MVIVGLILVAGRDTHSLGALENLKSIHVHFQIVKNILNYKKYLILA